MSLRWWSMKLLERKKRGRKTMGRLSMWTVRHRCRWERNLSLSNLSIETFRMFIWVAAPPLLLWVSPCRWAVDPLTHPHFDKVSYPPTNKATSPLPNPLPPSSSLAVDPHNALFKFHRTADRRRRDRIPIRAIQGASREDGRGRGRARRRACQCRSLWDAGRACRT